MLHRSAYVAGARPPLDWSRMLRYLEVFYRHRLLLIAPVIIALVASVGFAVTRPRTYEATAQLWFDPITSQSAQLNGYVSPSDQATSELKELLKTRSFSSKVGSRGPLREAVLTGGGGAGDPLSSVLNVLRGVPTLGASSNPQVLDDVLVDTINRHTTVAASGPQIIAINFDDANPQVAAGTAQAIVDQFSDELLGIRRSQAQATVDFYTGQLKDQDAVVAAADLAVNKYLQAHPGQRLPGALQDIQLTALTRADDLARSHYQDLVQNLDTGKLQIAAANQPGAAGFRVIDSPTVPYRAKGFVRAAVLAAAGGLVAGLFLMLVTLLVLTALDTSVRRTQEFPDDLSRRVVGSVPRLR
jgi:uncharacterized protein involved in exopolysaccharide biosynthesis